MIAIISRLAVLRFLYQMKSGILKTALCTLFFLPQAHYACAFHEFPPFGADWYHPTFFQLLYNSGHNNTIGFLRNTNNYARTFYLVPDMPGEEAHNQLLAEQISHKTFYYQFCFFSHLQCLVSVTETAIDGDAASDDGLLKISSASANQVSVLLGYDLEPVKRKNFVFRLQPAFGLGTNAWASHTFYSKIAWLKYQWNKFSPRLQAGNFTYYFQAGVSSSIEYKNLKMYCGINRRMFAINKEGYQFGTEINYFVLAGYHLSFARTHLAFEPQAGIIVEKAGYDKQQSYLHKDTDVFAGGKDLSLQVGCIFSVRNKVSLGFHYFFMFANRGFTQYQLYNTSRTQIFLQYSF